MCGIAGYWQRGRADADIARNMADQIAHRGPDDAGVWLAKCGNFAFAHRRLSIIDLTQMGHQPMVSPSNRYVISFNGEIYNHLELRSALSGRVDTWRGRSDTETLLAGFDSWGVEETLQRSTGMFAFALWDQVSGDLILARDRLGEKPLYYGWQGDTFLFGSELKALKVHPSFLSEIDRDALTLLMRHNCIQAPSSIWKDIYKLLPGCFLAINFARRESVSKAYWSGAEVIKASRQNPFAGSEIDAVNALDAVLTDAVRKQMIGDVPYGAFLSGGIDSSTIVALMQDISSNAIRTFSIGYAEERYNEAPQAKAIATYLGTSHTEYYVSPADTLAVVDELTSIYDEPFSDASQIPTYLVSKFAREEVSVALTGDGGDELFGGYNRYAIADTLWKRAALVPLPIRRTLGRVLTKFSPGELDRLARILKGLLPGYLQTGERIQKGAEVLAARNCGELYQMLVSHWQCPEALVLNGREPESPLNNIADLDKLGSAVEQMMAFDMLTYLPNDILTKVDRAAMRVSLETRVPFLDHRVVEFAWSLPYRYKIKDGESKWILRQLLYKHVPRKLVERPKMGFGIPIGDWLRGPLRGWADTLLDVDRLRGEGYFRVDLIREKWDEHLTGRRNWQYLLWDVLMFQSWLEQQ